MKIRKYVWIVVGLISFGLGTIGTVLPILPTVPLYLLALICFTNSSNRLHNWFIETKLYKLYLMPYLKAGGLTRKAKIGLILFVTLQIIIAAFIVHKSLVGILILSVVYLGFLISMFFIVKTIPHRTVINELNINNE